MKKNSITLSLSLIVLFLSVSCGYRNPYVYTGPDKSIYMTNWNNRTSDLQLDTQIYQSLSRWFQKSDSLNVVKNKSDADLILGGEIISIDLPSLSYGANNSTREVKLKMTVRYILKDLKSGEILFQVPSQLRSEEYLISSDSSSTADNEDEALETIIDELSQEIYLKTLAKLPKL